MAEFQHVLRVPYALCTVGNHVYYSRYLDLLEIARGELLRSAGIPLLELQAADTTFPVIGVELAYKAPARYDDVLTVAIWLEELSGVRLTFGNRITNESGIVLVEGKTRHVCATCAEKPKRLPAHVIDKLKPFLRDPISQIA